MTKGKYSVTLSAIAVIAFVLSFLNSALALLILLGYVLMVEQDEWLSKQTLQAFYLTLTASFAKWAVDAFFSILASAFSWLNLYSFFSNISNIFGRAVDIVVIVFTILAIINVMKEKDAAIPVLKSLAERSLGIIVEKKPAYQPYTAPAAPAQPVAAAPGYESPAPAPAPEPVPAPAPVPAPEPAPAPEQATAPAPDGWICPNCGAAAKGNFCGSCGTPKK